MAIVSTPSDSEATGLAAELFAKDIRSQGYVASHTRTLSINADALAAWNTLIDTIAGAMDIRRYELVTLAAARGVRSKHCLLAHGRKSLRYFDEDTLVHIAEDYHHAGLSDAEVTMMEFAEKVSINSAGMTDADSIRLRDAGFSDREIVDIALAAAARNFYSRAIQALAVDVDPPGTLSDRLATALVAGL
jgi:uncharacterized peroxidase-related enzyme